MKTVKPNRTIENYERVIEALMEELEKATEKIKALEFERNNKKLNSPSPTVLRALAIYGD